MSATISPTTRRCFLMLCAGAGGAVAFARARGDAAHGLQTFSKTSWALGADVSLTVLHADQTVAEKAMTAAFAELNLLEDILSVYRPNSQISRLNATGQLDQPHAHFTTVLNASQAMAKASDGRFDATVQPLWDVYAAAQKSNSLPPASDIAAARAKADYRKIQQTGSSVSFAAPGMKLTFNGIAQGYAADCVMAVLKSHGIENALVDAGELTSSGHKADGSAFRSGIQHPRQPDAFIGVCAMDGRALATSGDYATTFSDDFLYNHIFDPASGVSPRELASVSILAPTGIQADALTKPVFILGKEKGLKFIQSMPGCDAFIVTKDGVTSKTKGFPLV